MRADQAAKAWEILAPVYEHCTTDEIRVRAANVMAELNLAEGNHAQVADLINEVLSFPDRPGSDGPGSERRKGDAQRIYGTMVRKLDK